MSSGWQLVRVDPLARRGERLPLDPARESWRVGRSKRCDLLLHTATASREHARIVRTEDGRYFFEPLPGKRAEADGEPVTGRVELCEGLSLRLGGDVLRCRALEAASDAAAVSAAGAADDPGGAGAIGARAAARRRLGVAVLGLALLVAAVWGWAR